MSFCDGVMDSTSLKFHRGKWQILPLRISLDTFSVAVIGRVMTPLPHGQPVILSLSVIWGLVINLTVSKWGVLFNPCPTRLQSSCTARDPKYPLGADFLADSMCHCSQAACEIGCQRQTHPRAAWPENPAPREVPAAVPALQPTVTVPRAPCEETGKHHGCLVAAG